MGARELKVVIHPKGAWSTCMVLLNRPTGWNCLIKPPATGHRPCTERGYTQWIDQHIHGPVSQLGRSPDEAAANAGCGRPPSIT